MTIIINEENLDILRQEGIKNYPYECCGLLLGVINNSEKKVIKVIPTDNDWENQKHLFPENYSNFKRDLRDSFAINPLTFLKVQKQARNDNLNIIGIYHSHPDHPANPSDFDEAIASCVYSYIILSVEKGEIKEMLSWVLSEENKFVKEETTIAHESKKKELKPKSN